MKFLSSIVGVTALLFVVSCSENETFNPVNSNNDPANSEEISYQYSPDLGKTVIEEYTFPLSKTSGTAGQNAIFNGIIINTSLHIKRKESNLITYSVVKNAPNGVSQAEFEDLIRQALQVWSSAGAIAFKKVSSNASVTIKVSDEPEGREGTEGTGANGCITLYNKKWYYHDATNTSKDTIKNDFYPSKIWSLIMHEMGHELGFHDMRRVNYDGLAAVSADPANPTLKFSDVLFDDKDYYKWRMSKFGTGSYNLATDSWISIMDYDGSKPFWGKDPQWAYLSAYDVALLQFSCRFI